ncbi:MAG: hypothetical protein JRF56_10395 [Deltaproteobacteria bacterium]|jgi:hypothetical protein|nr:hypothetical protein [Deltaproteobacteria bacterium]
MADARLSIAAIQRQGGRLLFSRTRLISHWNLFERRDWIQINVGIQRLQLVPFAEIGDVAPSWNFETLHSEMKCCLGLGDKAWSTGSLLNHEKPWSGDLDGMVERHKIRALVPYSKTFYFLDGATPRGISYEGMQTFGKWLNKQLGTGTSKFV